MPDQKRCACWVRFFVNVANSPGFQGMIFFFGFGFFVTGSISPVSESRYSPDLVPFGGSICWKKTLM
jgi:hypothetical protein